MRVLIGTLHAGENELELARASITAQTHRDVEHVVFADLPNRVAHETLYSTFMARADAFDLFVKLDADMVFRDPDGLRRLVALFAAHADVHHAQLAVHDWFSDGLMMGLHAYRNTVRWPLDAAAADEHLFVDPFPTHPGRRLDVWDAPAPLVDHCPDPSPSQAFHFGVHRALKVVQRGRPTARFDAPRSLQHYEFLQRTWSHFERDGDRRLGLAVLGADLIYERELDARRVDAKADELEAWFATVADLDATALRARLAPRWSDPATNLRRHRRRVRLRAAGRLANRALRRLVAPGRG